MKTLKSKIKKVPVGLIMIVLALSAAISCSKEDDGYGNNNNTGGNNNGSGSAVSIRNMAFSPSTITVKAGTTVTWKNNDNVAHTVTSDDGLFDSGSISQGSSFSQKFDSTGTYGYYCTIHPTMKGSVVVN